ncbi:MAG: tagatose 1,6-diphosphate aldolase [Gaiellales bacterium]|nr:tagatose 1,6-diphosphate aldolase [Gaiellales bacterium]
MSAPETAARLGRLRGLDTLSDARGIFALAAMDHRDSLRVAFEKAGHPTPPPERITELKVTVARALAPHATGLLIDMELGVPAVALGAPGPCGIVVPLEAQGYEDVAAGRVTTFLPGFSPALARVLGAAACKLLLPYRPDHEASAARQDDVVRQALASCHAEGLPLILEPIAYALPDETPDAFAQAFPSLVVASAQRLQALGPDVLKLQFPRDDHGDEAAWCKQVDDVCGPTPWVLLGGGGAPEAFARDLRVACAAGASGFIAGRTLWAGVIGDEVEAETWLRRVGVPLLRSLRDIAQSGRSWRERVGPQAAPPPDWFA